MDPRYYRPARPHSRSRTEQMMFLRRRIVVGVGALVVLVALVWLLFGRSGSGTKPTAVGPKAGGGTTTSTAPPVAQLAVAAAPWQLTTALSRAVVLPLGSHLGVFGGLGPGSITSSAVTDIDPATGKGVKAATLPKPVHDAAGANIGAASFVFGGGAATESASVQKMVVDAAGKAGVTLAGTLPTKRADLVAVPTAAGVVVLGGFDGTHWLASVLQTTDGTTFTTIAQLTTPVRYPAATVAGNTLYVFGGELTGSQADATVIQAIDLQSHAVSVAGQLPGGLSHASAATLNGVIYLFGGRSGGHTLDTVSTFDPRNGQLQTVGHLPAPTSDMGVTTIDQTVYLVGGETSAGRQVNSVFIARLGGG